MYPSIPGGLFGGFDDFFLGFFTGPRPGTSSQVTEKLFLSRSDSLNLLIMKVSSPRPLYFNWPIKALFSILAIPAMRMNG